MGIELDYITTKPSSLKLVVEGGRLQMLSLFLYPSSITYTYPRVGRFLGHKGGADQRCVVAGLA